MSEILSLDLLNLDRLDEDLENGRLLTDDEARELCDYFMAHPKRSPLLYGKGVSHRAVAEAMRQWLKLLADRRHPDASAERFTWRVRSFSDDADPMLWFRNDQTGLILFYYRPSAEDLQDFAAVLRRCIRAVFPVLNVLPDVTELYLQQAHTVRPYTGSCEPEDAWLELATAKSVPEFYIAYNLQEQRGASKLFADQPVFPEKRPPIALLSLVLHTLAKKDPALPGGVFVKRNYLLRVQIEKAWEKDENAPSGYAFHPVSLLRKSTLQRLTKGEIFSGFNLFLPPEDARELTIEIDAQTTFYALARRIHEAYGWKESWNTFSSPEGDFTAFDCDEAAGAFKDCPPEETRSTSDILLSEYFETRNKCIYNNHVFLLSVALVETRDIPLQGLDLKYRKRKFMIRGGTPLRGEVTISGSRLSAFAVLAAAVLCPEPVTIRNLPDTEELRLFLGTFSSMGRKVTYPDQADPHAVCVSPGDDICYVNRAASVTDPILRNLPLSHYLLGALLGRHRLVHWMVQSFGFHDYLGMHPMDQQLHAFEQMGAIWRIEDSRLIMIAKDGLRGCRISLDHPGNLITINLILAAVTAEGKTVIENASTHPCITDMVLCLQSMGARIRGAGTGRIEILGIPLSKLHGTDHTIFPDASEAGSFLCMAAATGGNVMLRGVIPAQLENVTQALRTFGAEILVSPEPDVLQVRSTLPLQCGRIILNSRQVGPFPILPQLAVCAAVAGGVSSITVGQDERAVRITLEALSKMGVDVARGKNDDALTVRGSGSLAGAELSPTVQQMIPGFVAAGLAADGVTTIHWPKMQVEIFDHFIEKLKALGGNIEEIETTFAE